MNLVEKKSMEHEAWSLGVWESGSLKVWKKPPATWRLAQVYSSQQGRLFATYGLTF
jgi:hypothetical protein